MTPVIVTENRSNKSKILLAVLGFLIFVVVLIISFALLNRFVHQPDPNMSKPYIKAVENAKNDDQFAWPTESASEDIAFGPDYYVSDSGAVTINTNLEDFRKYLTKDTHYKMATTDNHEMIAIEISDKGFEEILNYVGVRPSDAMPDSVFLTEYAAEQLDYWSKLTNTDYVLTKG